jgi:predicted phosphoadenosine phosphosulfate sulfurtransferase
MNVYEAAIKRINILFDNFQYLYVSFSGGKDSGVLLELCAKVARERGVRFGIFHMDYEAQYTMTTEYVVRMLERYKKEADIYHVCVPFKVTTSTSMFQSYWRPYEETKRNIWVKDMPDNAMTEKDFPFFNNKMWDYDFQDSFGEWLADRYESVCCLIGIRTGESLNRWRAVHSDRNYKTWNGYSWTNTANKCVTAYPIHDWTVEDVWTANAKNMWDYNKLYDLFYYAGVPLHKQRVASPFLSEGMEAIRLYQVIEPDTWGRLIGRVNGVNFAGLYGGTTAMGWKKITKPKHFTWEQYMYFLLDTLPEKTKKGYLDKLATSVKFWKERGGVLDDATIEQLRKAGVKIEVEYSTNYNTKKKPVKMDYQEDFEGKNFKDIPTYKRMCICIIKNDHLCKYMGFSLTKDEVNRRKAVQEKYKYL